MLSCAEFVCHFEIVRSVVAWKLAVDTVAQIHIDNFVILASCKECITWVLDRLPNSSGSTLSSSLGSLSWVLDFSDLVPLVFSVTPHEGECRAVFSENLDEAIRLATNFTFDLSFKVWQFADVDLLSSLGCSFAFFLILGEIGAFLVLSFGVASKLSNLFVFCANENITILVMSYSPDCLWQLYCLLAGTISPEFDGAVVSSGDDLARREAIDGKNEAIVTFEIHHVGSIERPKFHHLVIRDRRESIQLWHLNKTTHDVLVANKFFLLLAVEPESDLFVLTARDGDPILQS